MNKASIKRTLFLPSCRPAMMFSFLNSLKYLEGWDLLLCTQAYTKEDWSLLKRSPQFHRITDILEYPERRFPYPTRIEMYRKWYGQYDVWCSMDDDMELLSTVNYQPMLDKCLEPGVGVISGNWVKHESFLKRIGPAEEWIEKPLVNMAGGQIFSTKIIDILLESDVKPYLFCDIEVALKAYVKGYTNYRYRGSLIIHRIMAKAGLSRTFREFVMELPNPKYCRVRPTQETICIDGIPANNWHMPIDNDVTALARLSHKNNIDNAIKTDNLYWRY
jgi:hypothetical protein